MAKKSTTIGISAVLLVVLIGGILFFPYSGIEGGGGGVTPSSATCPSGMVVYQVSNAGSGALSVLCQSGGSGSYTYATCVSNQYVYGNATTGFLCSQISYSQLAGALYFTCPTGQYSYGNQSSGLQCSAVSYSQLSGSLSCSSGYVLATISNVATCVPVAETESAATTVYVDPSTGSGTTCTSSTPCASITEALSILPTVLNYPTIIDVACASACTDVESITLTNFIITASLTFQGATTSTAAGTNCASSLGATGCLFFNGQTSANGTANTLVDSSASWGTNQFAGGTVFVYYNSTSGNLEPPVSATIASNTATTLTLKTPYGPPNQAFSTASCGTTCYFAITSDVTIAPGSGISAITDNNKPNINVYGLQFSASGSSAAAVLYEYGGTGAVEYCLFNIGASGFGELVERYSTLFPDYYNYYSLTASTAVGIEVTASVVYSRGSAFVGASGTSAVGITDLQQGLPTLTTSVSLIDTFYRLADGIEVENLGQLFLGAQQDYIGVTDPILYSVSSDSQVILPIDTANCDPGLTSTTYVCFSYTPPPEMVDFQLSGGLTVTNCALCVLTVTLGFTDASGASQSYDLFCGAGASATTMITTTVAQTVTSTTVLYSTTRSTSTETVTFPQTTYATTSVRTSTTFTTTSTSVFSTTSTQTFTSYSQQPLQNPIMPWGVALPQSYSCFWNFGINGAAQTVSLTFNLLEGKGTYYPYGALSEVT